MLRGEQACIGLNTQVFIAMFLEFIGDSREPLALGEGRVGILTVSNRVDRQTRALRALTDPGQSARVPVSIYSIEVICLA